VEIVRLALGQRPSDDSDCIKIEETSDGRFALTGTALCQLSGADAESVSLVATEHFQGMSEAEEAGLVWANAQGVQTLHIGYGTLALPLELADVDRPL
jgi:hypothetical protein